MKPGFNLQLLSRFVAAAAAAALPLAVSAQESKGPSEKDCRNVNFPSSEQRLVRACNARFNLCAAPPPAWTQIPQVMQVCQSIKREQQLQGVVGAPGSNIVAPGSNIVAPAREVSRGGSLLLQPAPSFGNPPPKP